MAVLVDLGADAVPMIVGRLNSQTPDTDMLYTLARFLPPGQPDWRVWNLARSCAAAVVQNLEVAHPLAHWGKCQASYDD